MPQVKFKYADEACVYPKLIAAVNTLCAAKGKDALCTSGYRSLEKQKVINRDVLLNNPGNIQYADGSVYNKAGQCLAAAYGKSNHCFCIAMDITDSWLRALTNTELAPYGLVKPMTYEPWHVQLAEHSNLSQAQKEAIRDSVLGEEDGEMTVKEFQTAMGLTVDGIVGPKTQAKAKEVLQVCQAILCNDFKTPEEVINATQSSPADWNLLLQMVKYFDRFIMNIVNRMGGKAQ